MRTRFLIVRNQNAGSGRHALTDQVVRILTQRGCEIVPAAGLPHAFLNSSSDLETFDAVIAAGGDGTLRRLLVSEAGRAVPIGIIPAGTGNVLAEELALSGRPGVLADTLMAGPEYVARVGTLNGEHFLSMAGVGFDARIVRRLNPKWKQRIGKAAYVLPALGAFFGRQPRFDIDVDGKKYTASWLVATKLRYYAGRFVIAPDAKLTDGRFTVILFQSKSRWTLASQLLALSAGAVERAPAVTVVHGSVVSVGGAGQGIPIQVDGDAAGWAPAEIKIAGHVRLIVPSRYIA